jgi:transcriptional pleiotropic regulator of transition state genes
MKAMGIVRRIDDLGRIVVPKELRRSLELAEGDPVEIFVNGRDIILRKYERGCTFCSVLEGDHIEVKGKLICSDCRKLIAR